VVGLISGDSGEVPGTVALVGAAASRIPSVAVMVAVALLAAAAMPSHARAIGWGALVVAFGLGELGTLVGLPTWLADVSPFAHVSALPPASSRRRPRWCSQRSLQVSRDWPSGHTDVVTSSDAAPLVRPTAQ